MESGITSQEPAENRYIHAQLIYIGFRSYEIENLVKMDPTTVMQTSLVSAHLPLGSFSVPAWPQMVQGPTVILSPGLGDACSKYTFDSAIVNEEQ